MSSSKRAHRRRVARIDREQRRRFLRRTRQAEAAGAFVFNGFAALAESFVGAVANLAALLEARRDQAVRDVLRTGGFLPVSDSPAVGNYAAAWLDAGAPPIVSRDPFAPVLLPPHAFARVHGI